MLMLNLGKLRAWLPWLAVLLLAALAAQPLWGLPPQGDDLLLHYFRIPLVNAQWAAGVPLARWQPDLVYGYGSPLFNFYPPLSAWLLTALYWLTGQQADVAINLLFALCLLLGAVGMFGLGRALAGELGGLVATAVFTFSPHVAAQIYSRGSTSNSLALGLVPLAAWLIWRVVERPSARKIVLAALVIALLLLSHAAASLLLLAPLLVWSATFVLRWGGSRRWLVLLAAAVLGLTIAAFAWLPAFTEIQFTRYAAEAGKVWYGDYFATLWAWPGTAVAGLRGAYLPKTVGLVALILGAGGTAVSGYGLLNWWRKRGEFPAQDALFFAAGLLGWGVLFLTLPVSDLVWQFVEPLRGLQFPWRLLDVPAFFLPIAALGIFYRRERKERGEKEKSLRSPRSLRLNFLIMALLVTILASYVNLVPYLYPPRWVGLPERPSLSDVTTAQQTYQIIGLTAWGEYSDARVSAWPTGPVMPAGSSLADKLVTAVSGKSLTLQESDPWTAVWQTNFDEPTALIFASHIFPGWQASLDGDGLAVVADENGRLQLTIPPGEHTLEIWFGRTPVRWLADFVSVAGLLVCLWLVVKPNARIFTAEVAENAEEKEKTLRPPRSLRLIPGMVMVLAILLLLGKVLWLDSGNSPLVVQVVDGRIPHIPAPPAGNFGDELQLVGVETTLPNELVLYWQALQPPAAAYEVVLTLLDGRGVPQQTIVNPTPGFTVFTNLSTGQLLRDPYTILLPDTSPASYTVQISLRQPETEFPLSIQDANGDTTIHIARLKTPPEMETAVPPTATPLDTQFGDAILLTHADLPTTISLTKPLDLTLYWQAIGPINEDYTAFMHLLTPEGEFVLGQDGQPLGGLYPTSFWGEGELVVDGRSWFADVPPGEYQLQVGLYLLATGQRLPVSGPHSELGDRVLLGIIEFVP
ncbi:MAG: glycosyltransferase family 39 protein [Anaerolineales bacterium]|nr:glycosyltransferase family 39 protein [Anaerolineales bacterium]